MEGEVVEPLIDAPRAEEVEDDLVRSLEPGLFDLVEEVRVLVEVGAELIEASAQLLDLAGVEELEGCEEALFVEGVLVLL